MFQFTTTTVINSNVDASGKHTLFTGDTSKNTFTVKGVGTFKKENVSAIYKAVGTNPELAKVVINLKDLEGAIGDQFRLSIYVGLTQASQDSRYSNDMIYKGKPFAVDFIKKDTEGKLTAKSLADTIKKYDVLVYGEKMLNAYMAKKGDSDTSFLVIEATTEYQRFKKVNIEKFDAEAHWGMGEYKVVKSLDDIAKKTLKELKEDSIEGCFEGKEGFGTYSYLLHNLRLPTSARTDAFALNQEESPIVGALYNQYTIHYCVNRGILGTNGVGDVVKSVTTHVFYVNSAYDTEFANALNGIGKATEVTGHTVDPVDPDLVSVGTIANATAEQTAQAKVDAAIAALKKANPTLQ